MSEAGSLNDINIEDSDSCFSHGSMEIPVQLSRSKASNDSLGSWDNASHTSVNPRSHPAQLKFEVVASRTIESNHRNYVAYTILVRMIGKEDDPYPAVIERRYNDFLALYNALKRDYPNQMASVPFPKKVFLGNFSSGMITTRIAGFEALLDHISENDQLKDSPVLVKFLQNRELTQAVKLLLSQQYEEAKPLIENGFRLSNKVCTDRSPAVMTWLCLLIAVCYAMGACDSRALTLASLAIHRFQGVSDIDLLRYYVPLLHTAANLCRATGKDPAPVISHLDHLRKKGCRVDPEPTLLQILLQDLNVLLHRPLNAI